MLLTDSLIGAGTAIAGTAVQGSSVGPVSWRPDITGAFRGTGGGTSADSVDGSAWADIPYTGTDVEHPDLVVIEGEFQVSGSGFYLSASLEATGDGFFESGVPAKMGASIVNYGTYTEYRVYKGGTFSSSVFSDSASYSGYVKRRMEVDTIALTYACFANDVLIASGSFTTSAVRDPTYATGMSVKLYFDRRFSSGGNVANLRNMSVSIETLATASEFWTDLVNAYEVV